MLRTTDNSPKNESNLPALPPLQELSNLRSHHKVHCYACGKQEGQMMTGRKGAVYYAKFACANCGFEFDYGYNYGVGVHPTDLNMAHDAFSRKTLQHFSQLLIGHKEKPEVLTIEGERYVPSTEIEGEALRKGGRPLLQSGRLESEVQSPSGCSGESETEEIEKEEVKGKLLKFVPRWKKKTPT